MVLAHNFCLGKLSLIFLPLALNFHDLNKVDLSLEFCLFVSGNKLVSTRF